MPGSRVGVVALLVALGVAFATTALASPAVRVPDAANPAWSPDGTQIGFAYLSPAGRLETMRATDGGAKQTVYSTNDGCCEPILWAASGRIAFVSDYRLQSVSAAGGKPTQLFGDSPWFILSPDRATVAFDDGCGCGHAPDAIGLVDVAGGKPRVIPKPKNATDSIDGFSPDGTDLVFTRYPFANGEPVLGKPSLMAEQVRGGTSVPLSRSALIGSSLLPAGADDVQWSPDGRWIAFVDAQKLEVVSTTGGKPRVLVPARFGSFSWSPSSKRLAYVADGAKRPYSSRLATVDVQGHRKVLWSGSLHYLSNDTIDRPQWSPDGTKLVFMGIVGAGRPQAHVWVVGEDGRGLKKLA